MVLARVGDGAHALHEHVDIDVAPDRAALVAGLIACERAVEDRSHMNNIVKTALLLGVLSALLMFIGEALGGAQGMVLGFFFAVVTNFGSYWFSDKIVLRMYSATGSRTRPSPLRHRRPPRAARRSAAAALLRHSRRVAERVRDRPQSAARRGRRDRRHPADSQRRRTGGRARARARARQAPRHPDQLDRRDAGRRDHDDFAVRDVLRRRPRRRPARRRTRSR